MRDDLHKDTLELRRQMIDRQLRARGLRGKQTLAAILRIPREHFLPEHLHREAYNDTALPIDFGQTISQPYIVAYMTEHLDLSPHHRVLEIGTGSGYQTAILSMLAAQVFTVEHIPELANLARKRLDVLNLRNIEYRIADGTNGWPEYAPFDRIIVTAGAPYVPKPLADQLADSGILVIPVGDREHQRLMHIRKSGDRFIEGTLIGCRFIKLVGEQGWKD